MIIHEISSLKIFTDNELEQMGVFGILFLLSIANYFCPHKMYYIMLGMTFLEAILKLCVKNIIYGKQVT